MDDKDDVRGRVEAALTDLLREDRNLLEIDVREQTLTSRLKSHLESYFHGCDLDCEYNRIGMNGDVKQITDTRKNAQPKAMRDVKPDIIIHRRTRTGGTNNFVAIEAKKAGLDDSDDRVKLEGYKNELHYQHAFLITFPTKDQLDSVTVSSCVKSI